MNILFIHQNFPAQFHRISSWLLRQGEHRLVAIRQEPIDVSACASIEVRGYTPRRQSSSLDSTIEDIPYNAAAVASLCKALRDDGFYPDVILGHSFWGEPLHVRDVFPKAKIITYFERFQAAPGAWLRTHDRPGGAADQIRRLHGAFELEMLRECDAAISPAAFQRATYPAIFRDKIAVIHEGLDTGIVKPNPQTRLNLKTTLVTPPTPATQGLDLTLKAGDEVLTYVSRYLEPARGYDQLLKALPAIQAARPHCHTLILGVPGQQYGPALELDDSGRPVLEMAIRQSLDLSRVHWLGHVSHEIFLALLQVSRCHVYWSAPTILSWSFLEALAVGCRVVSCRNAMIEEIVSDTETALLGNFESSVELGKLAVEVLANAERYAPMAGRARDLAVSRFDLEAVSAPAYWAMMTTASA